MTGENRSAVIMLGPSLDSRGGMATVVNGYIKAGIRDICDFEYIETTRPGSVAVKALAGISAYARFRKDLPACDIVHLHIGAGISPMRKSLFAKAAKRAGKAVVIHEHRGVLADLYRKGGYDFARKTRELYELAPAPVLNFFEGCDRILCVSDPDARYYAHMNLRAMLSGLAVDDRSLNTLAESVMRYFKDGDAEHDLDVMEDGLPPEAILRRSQVLRERAALALMVGENVERAVSYTDEAIGLLEGSLQVMAALECRWQLARLTLYDKPEVAKMQLSIAEERLATLNKQPSLGYPYLEMSLCYALLGMRAECRGAYERAAGFETPMSHYAPGIRINITAAAFCARFYMLTEMLGNPEEVCPLLKTREGRAWLSRYPKVSSLSKTLLCGKFLGYGDVVPAMTRLFLDEAGKLYAETWLVVQEIGLAFDLDSRKPGEEYGLVVEIQRHPLVADDDALARVAVQHGYTVLGARLDLCNEDLLGVDDAAAVFDVLDALGILAEGRVPTLEDIMKSYLESCVDVPAGGWGTFAER